MSQITIRLALVLLVGSTLVQYALCTTTITGSSSTVSSTTTGNTGTTTVATTTAPPSSTTLGPTTTVAGTTVTPTSAPTTTAAGGGASTTTNAAASSTVSTSGSSTTASGTTGSTVSSSTVSSTATTTAAPAECLNQNCTGNLTCLDTNGATCLLGNGQCYQVVISNSTYSMVYTGCSDTCEAVDITAGDDYQEEKRCCTTNKCNGDVIALGGNSANSFRITTNLLVCLLFIAMVLR